MQRLNKPFEPITTLIIIYFALVTVSIALYALIKIFFKSDADIATSLLGWTATMFATIALLYTFHSWRDQKSSEIVSEESKLIFKFLHSNHQCFNNIFENTDSNLDERSYQYVRDNYSKYIENLNLYNSLILIMKKQNTEKEFKKYMEMLKDNFKSQVYNKEKLERNKDYIFECSKNLEEKVVSIILHMDD